MKRLAVCLLICGVLTIVFSSMVYDDLTQKWSSLLELGDVPVYALVITGMFCIGAGCLLLLEDKRRGADALITRSALQWGRMQGKIVRVAHGMYQFVENAQALNRSTSEIWDDKGS